MPAVVVVGAQWGDEGKGKATDLLADSVSVVVRYQGGDNAGQAAPSRDQLRVDRVRASARTRRVRRSGSRRRGRMR